MKTNKKLSLKGMTLMEIIIAIAVMAIISMIIVMAGVSAVHNLRIAHNVSEKNAKQSPYASAKIGADSTGQMTITLNNTAGSLTVDTYEVKENETSGDRVGNYRYFENPTPTPTPTTGP